MHWILMRNTFDKLESPITGRDSANDRKFLSFLCHDTGTEIELTLDGQTGAELKILEPRFDSTRDVDDFLSHRTNVVPKHWLVKEQASDQFKSATLELSALLPRQFVVASSLLTEPHIALSNDHITLIQHHSVFRKPSTQEQQFFIELSNLSSTNFAQLLAEALAINQNFIKDNALKALRHSDALIALGRRCLNLGLVDEALTSFKTQINDYPDNHHHAEATSSVYDIEHYLPIGEPTSLPFTDREAFRSALIASFSEIAKREVKAELFEELYKQVLSYAGLKDLHRPLTRMDMCDPALNFQLLLEISDSCYQARVALDSVKQRLAEQDEEITELNMILFEKGMDQLALNEKPREFIFRGPDSASSSSAQPDLGLQTGNKRFRPA